MLIKQKEVYLVNFGSASKVVRKVRPALVVQNNVLNKNLETILVVPLSSSLAKRPSFQIPFNSDFLDNKSYILTNLVCVVEKKSFDKKIGTVGSETYNQVTKALAEIVS